MLLVAAGVGLLAAVLAVVLVVALVSANSTPEARIRQVVTDFSAALDFGDVHAMVGLLCSEEALGITEDDDYDPNAEPGENSGLAEPTVRGIRIDPAGVAAEADVMYPGQEPITLSLVREDDRWKLCNPFDD